MKTIFHKIFLVLLLISASKIVLPEEQDLFTEEVRFTNRTTNIIYIKCYPISLVFNGHKNYDLVCKFRYIEANSNLQFDYINGVHLIRNLPADTTRIKKTVLQLPSGAAKGFGLDIEAEPTHGSLGYGKYKIIIANNVELSDIIDTLTIEYDWGYHVNSVEDLEFFYNTNGRISFAWGCANVPERYIDDSDVNRKLESWNQYECGSSAKDFGNFNYNSSNNNNYTIFPQDSRIDCNIISGPEENQVFDDNRSGTLTLNLTIDKNVTTRDILVNNPTNIIVTKKVILRINDNRIFSMITPSSPSGGYTNLIIEDSAYLQVRPNAKLDISSPNRITLKNKGYLLLNPNSEMILHPGATFCNEGGKVFGNARIIFKGGTHQQICPVPDFLLQDSIKFILDTNAILSIPNNITLHLRGNTTSLIMNRGSKLLFGENSGIVCDSGGKLIANNATFASSDSTKKWNGISLSDLSQDTLKNCTIKNAMYGVCVSEKYDAEDTGIPCSTEISGCGFINQTNYVLNNGVYVAGSNNVLIMNNTVSSSSLEKGYTHGIYAEYCPDGDFNIIGNTISGAGNGMTLIGCSPFVAQNTLTGNEYSECGMFLDNSNGTFEYNVISDFYYSYFSYYSSPDLLKNVFDNYYDDNLWLSTSSVPVMHPLINAGSVYWYAGDNSIKGSPSDAGILFDEDACPHLNYGYNRFEMTNNDYYISGTNPSGGSREFYVIQNYWDGTPDSNKFNVVNADVIYIPYDNNSSSARETNSDEKFDIGFGLYDTVYYYEPDNPNSAQDLYLEAYQKEYAGEFSQAIDIYKEIVEEYKDSSYTSSCLSRIFSCFEKKNSTQNEYSSLENYYSIISNDTSYTEIQRNISEEFMIKSKVKQNNIEEAISDYNAIYTQNMNTPKGTHAFINKEILSQGSGDNISGGSIFENIEVSQNALISILSNLIHKDKNIFTELKTQPEGYSLSQNYPNPFNPVTKINYELRIKNYEFVSLKVFDALGKEVTTLVNERQSSGSYSVEWDAANYPSGIYFYSLYADGKAIDTKRMILIK